MATSTSTLIAESRLDAIIVQLINGDPEARTAWMSEVPALLQSVPDYDVAGSIRDAIEARLDYDSFCHASAVSREEHALHMSKLRAFCDRLGHSLS